MTSSLQAARANSYILEVCCGSAHFAATAAEAGADRLELCDNLVEGGTTPSAGSIQLVLERVAVPLMIMIRPRGGDFLYSEIEFEVMLRDITVVKELGVHGVVFGVLTEDGRIDRERTSRLVDAARPMAVTFHRAFDVSRDPWESLDVLVGLGVDRILTSAQRASVFEDLPLLSRLVDMAGGGLTILPGGGIRADNVGQVLAVPGVREVHIGASRRVPSGMVYRAPGVSMGEPYQPDEYMREEADADRIKSVSAALAAHVGDPDRGDPHRGDLQRSRRP
ncbi:MAG: copper homeostasis protein CutC [Gemmatimonadetes bacterium]|nr:copper homeostasis protein CutC [Gemmatimonadota bacterium]MDA1103907.1 copper homeostasis protein CutC [Gemmatimonadota bacterium]